MLYPLIDSMLLYARLAWDQPDYESQQALERAALDAYIYGFPLVLMDVTKRTGAAGLTQKNRFYHQKVLSTPKFTQVIRPNVDTLYSSAWLDLSAGPLLLHVPDTNGRYYLLPMLDAWSNVFASIGARTTGTKEQIFVLAGPGWQGNLPPNLPVIHTPTNKVWITGRIQTNGPQDYPAVHAIQRELHLSRLNPQAPELLQDHLIISQHSPKDLVASMDAAQFFNLMMSLMYRNPPYPAIQSPEMSMKLQALGLIPSPSFQFSSLNSRAQEALTKAVAEGPKAIEAAEQKIFTENETNGWSMLLRDIGHYGTNYIQRAVVAKSLFGANIPEDAVYAYNFKDNQGNPLDGNNQYTIRFPPGQTPPAQAFWSITLYNTEGFLVKNSLNRYAVSPHLGNLQYNRDGSLDIYVQHASPGTEIESNCLPAPEGPFNLMLRIYWPQSNVLHDQWHPPAVARSF
ncbi:DUF1254 domain-containing protein [Paenibacillus sp. 32352]|uniref:DUF1254 domain-containing protein n=1 Tax=Paenibacillus sp. 32352 TaxID=1969111 RepID=UPI0015C450D8|nr:DUF1254 domain-containing protein [Paenibacillus sp. 32352]